MFNFAVYRKFVNLNNGKRVLLRPLLEEDQKRLYDLFSEAPEDDTKYLKDEVKKPEVVGRWIENLDYSRVLPLVAYADDRLVGDVARYRGTNTFRHVGEIRIFLARDFRGVGLGGKMIQETCEIAKKISPGELRRGGAADVVALEARAGRSRCRCHADGRRDSPVAALAS